MPAFQPESLFLLPFRCHLLPLCHSSPASKRSSLFPLLCLSLSWCSLYLSGSPFISDSSLLSLLFPHHAICPPVTISLNLGPCLCLSTYSLLCGCSLPFHLSHCSVAILSFHLPFPVYQGSVLLPLCPVSLSPLSSPSLPAYLYHCPFLSLCTPLSLPPSPAPCPCPSEYRTLCSLFSVWTLGRAEPPLQRPHPWPNSGHSYRSCSQVGGGGPPGIIPGPALSGWQC